MAPLAARQSGVVSRRQLRALGLSRHDVRTEVEAGRWGRHGHQVITVSGPLLADDTLTRWWAAVLEAGPGAALDGASALQAAGLTGFTPGHIDVCVPMGCRSAERRPSRALTGVRLHQRRDIGRLAPGSGVPRVPVECATLRAAFWAVSDRQAALLLLLPVQQRLTTAERLDAELSTIQRASRRALISVVLRDCIDGVRSLHELDFARLCRQSGLPEPSRQVVRKGPGGRVYLDVCWEDIGLGLEVDGAGHAAGLTGISDLMRQNEVALDGTVMLRTSVVGLTLEKEAFMGQVVRAHARLTARAGGEDRRSA